MNDARDGPGLRDARRARVRRAYEAGWYSARTLRDEVMAPRERDAELVFTSPGRPSRTTVGATLARSTTMARTMRRLGVRTGDVVAVQLPNWEESIVAYQACFLIGAVVLPIVHIYGVAEIGFILRQSGARVLVVPDVWRGTDYSARFGALGDIETLEQVVVVGDHAPAGALLWHDLEAAPGDDDLPRPDVTADDVCLLVYTSGTTAAPKGVQHTHNSLLAELRANEGLLGAGGRKAALQAFPAGHIAGVLGLLRPIVNGATTVLMDTWDPHEAAALIEEHAITFTSGTPFHLTTLLDAAEAHGRVLTSLYGYMSGAANVPPALVERSQEAGFATYRCYGSSEHPTVSSGRPEDPIAKRAHTDGRVLPGNEVRIVDDDGSDLPAGAEGEIVTRGPELFCGYRDTRLDAGAFLVGGWYRTGDIGRLDGEGYLAITDRKKDIIIRGGENISSKEVEDVLVAHPSVADAAAVAVPDERYGERVCAFVTLRSGAALSLDDVRAHFRSAGVARQKTPERLEVVDDLPRTPAGKVKKFELRQRFR